MPLQTGSPSIAYRPVGIGREPAQRDAAVRPSLVFSARPQHIDSTVARAPTLQRQVRPVRPWTSPARRVVEWLEDATSLKRPSSREDRDEGLTLAPDATQPSISPFREVQARWPEGSYRHSRGRTSQLTAPSAPPRSPPLTTPLSLPQAEAVADALRNRLPGHTLNGTPRSPAPPVPSVPHAVRDLFPPGLQALADARSPFYMHGTPGNQRHAGRAAGRTLGPPAARAQARAGSKATNAKAAASTLAGATADVMTGATLADSPAFDSSPRGSPPPRDSPRRLGIESKASPVTNPASESGQAQRAHLEAHEQQQQQQQQQTETTSPQSHAQSPRGSWVSPSPSPGPGDASPMASPSPRGGGHAGGWSSPRGERGEGGASSFRSARSHSSRPVSAATSAGRTSGMTSASSAWLRSERNGATPQRSTPMAEERIATMSARLSTHEARVFGELECGPKQRSPFGLEEAYRQMRKQRRVDHGVRRRKDAASGALLLASPPRSPRGQFGISAAASARPLTWPWEI